MFNTYLSLFHIQHAYIGLLARLELLLEYGPPGPKRVRTDDQLKVRDQITF